MLDTLTQNIVYGTTYCVFEHVRNAKDTRIRLLVASYKKGEISILQNKELSAITEIKDEEQTIKHGQLIINNGQVLSKVVSQERTLTDAVLLNEAFPSIDVKDFYYEIIRLEGKAFLYICRKLYIEELIAFYEKEEVLITSWKLGSSAMKGFEALADETTSLTTEESTFLYNQGVLKEIFPNTAEVTIDSYTIQDLEVNRSYLNTLGAVLETVSGQSTGITTNATEAIKGKQDYYKQNRLYSLGLPMAIVILLIIFLANFFIYNHYFTQVEQMEVSGNTNEMQQVLLHKKDSIVDQKQRLFEDVVASSSSSSSYLMDQIIMEMPATILLDKLSYHPLKKSIKQRKPLAIASNLIEIAGNTSVNADLSTWISSLERLEFIKTVSIKELDKGGQRTNFKLTLKIGS